MNPSAQKELRFGSPTHDKTRDRLLDLINRSQINGNDRQIKWQDCEEQFLMYMPERDADRLRENEKREGRPQYTTIQIPYSYASVLTAHTYVTSTLFARDPILQVQGRHGEAQQQEASMEALLAYQVDAGGHLPSYYIWTLDALKYGVGIIGYYWDEEKYNVSRMAEVQSTFLGVPIPGKTEKKLITEEQVGYQGTRTYNVRPFDFFHDTSFPIGQFQKGSYCGRYCELSFYDILDRAGDEYFNIEELRASLRDGNFSGRITGSPQVTLPGTNQVGYGTENVENGIVHCHEVYIRLVPREWGLGPSNKTEKWVFLIAEKRVIISANPLGLFHNRFPFEVLEQEVDGHSLFSRSMLEITKPLNDTLTWLINTHFFNVRKSLNDQFVVDPSKVVMKDLTDPNPGRLIRLRPSAYGSDIKAAVMQLPVQDITRANLTDAQLVIEMLQRVTGVNDSIMGMVNSGRKTATEVRSSTTFGVNRLKTVTEYMSACGLSPWTQQLIQTTQQCYDLERKYRVVGDLAQWGDKYLNITPGDIAGFYDFTPVDGTLPVDRFAQVNLWNQLLSQGAQLPQIMQGYDFAKIFAFVAQLAGLKNINQFRIQVVPDAQVQQQAQAGNVIPMPGMGAVPDGQANNQTSGGEPNQIPGMGQTL